MFPIAQVAPDSHGWLTQRLLAAFTGNSEWVLWILAVASVLSLAVMAERAIFYSTHRLLNADELVLSLARGELEEVGKAIGSRKGMEAAMLREGLAWSSRGAKATEQVMEATVAKERPSYERFFSFLGTLGANTPFIGLFGTVLGIIKAFHDLGESGAKGIQVQQTVMAGISEALVATAVGLAVAIPAVIAYNIFTRELKHTLARCSALRHALVGYLHTRNS